MDTIETTVTPVGGEDVTSSQDTATQVDTQTAETGNGVDGTAQTESGQASETLLAGKYTSPQELEKAYLEAQKKISEFGQKAAAADLLQERFGISPEQLRQVIEQQEAAAMQQRMQNDPAGFALERVQTLEQQLALQNEEKQLDGFLQQNPEYAPFRDKILNLGLNLETNKSYEQIANEYFGHARAQGQQDAYKKIETKQNSQLTTAASTPHRKPTLDEMANMTAAELRAILPHSQR